jgi:hypothetical protein
LHGDIVALENAITCRLKKIIGWDFDLTLSKYFTDPRISNTVKPEERLPPGVELSPMRYPEKTSEIIYRVARDPQFIQIISSRNKLDRIQKHIKFWFNESKIFAEIFDEGSIYIGRQLSMNAQKYCEMNYLI